MYGLGLPSIFGRGLMVSHGGTRSNGEVVSIVGTEK